MTTYNHESEFCNKKTHTFMLKLDTKEKIFVQHLIKSLYSCTNLIFTSMTVSMAKRVDFICWKIPRPMQAKDEKNLIFSLFPCVAETLGVFFFYFFFFFQQFFLCKVLHVVGHYEMRSREKITLSFNGPWTLIIL